MKFLMDSNNKAQPTTRGIANKGFSGMRRLVIHFNFSLILIENCTQSLSGHTADFVYLLKKEQRDNK